MFISSIQVNNHKTKSQISKEIKMRFLSLTMRNIKEIYRDPISISLGMAMPVFMLILFVSIEKKAPMELFTVNMMTPAVTVFSFSFFIMFTAVLLTNDRKSAFLARLLTTPLTPLDFILAYFLPFIPLAIVQIIVCFGTGVILGMELSIKIFYLLIVFFPVALSSVGIGMIMGALFNENQVAGIGSLFVTVMGIFSGAWLDLKMVGGVFQKIGYAFPYAHAIDASRAIIRGSSFSAVLYDFYWTLIFAAAMFIIGVFAFAWKTRR